MRFYGRERGFRNPPIALLAASCVWAMALVPAHAEDLSIQSIVGKIKAEASTLSEAAHAAHPTVGDIANKALSLSTTMAALDPAMKREPDQASSHGDALKQLAADEINLGLAITSLSDADAGTAKDLIAKMAAVADDIKNDASAY
jgi:hypothetical protein